ncbi:MAG: VWA domain-containing protein [Actinobacteria bacterium]|nr:VWA domain-containing protein [Actinomycetota bacterium]
MPDLASFAQALRSRGMTVTSDQVGEMARSLLLVDPAQRAQVHAALRSLSITDPAQRETFDEEFRRFFGMSDRSPRTEGRSGLAGSTGARPIIHSPEASGEGESLSAETGASNLERLAHRDFAELEGDEAEQARRLVMTMLWQPSDFRTRRWVAAPRGRRPDLRRTFKGAIGPEGDLLRISRRERRLRQRPLIVIADVSGSMASYADMFLVFAHAASRRLDTVEVFTFSTELTRITEDLKKRDVGSALAGVARTVSDWSGGTRIGEAVGTWNREWSRRMARGGPVALILSDGWDTGDPAVLSKEMRRLARSVHKVVWLNPLAARSDYRPATRGMRAALPHIDHLLPAASVEDLRGVVRVLESMAGLRV